MPVLFVRILVNMILGGRASGETSTQSVPMAHFRILLVLDDSSNSPLSIELNSVGLVTTTGLTRMHVISRNWTHSAGTTRVLAEQDVHFIPGHALPTVDTVLNLLVGNKRHHYMLHASGSGCRYWTKVVLQDLIRAGYMAPGSDSIVATIKDEIAKANPQILMLADAEGTFF
ncbi:hypothetical protein BD311DRAFT_670545 [Dichomitus squalens]|uniref:DUF7770 domain-containing protein n=1 Tax=Dichomitus squalens TaxID=114155 RepID=A0A4Q9QBX7_9APHY|nr:hypothetical protein BD311DRAFT_670545 [Dichomitus squalens]TBU65227.1 hypothetical protein BD310DRAFT_914296 [Dichomitus squalens]